MLGLQGKSAKPAIRAPLSKGTSGPNRTMAANSNQSRASSISSDKPERLSHGPSPYSATLTKAPTTGNRRVQSAAPFRQRSSLGPTIKASELFRKNSEPQLANKGRQSSLGRQSEDNSVVKGNKNKQVRIDPDTPASPSSIKSRMAAPTNFLRSQNSSGNSNQSRRPFSFSSDRSRSISAASVASNDSASTLENELHQEETMMGSGDAPGPLYWKRDYENNMNRNTTNFDELRSHPHPRLSKRSYSMDATSLNPYSLENTFPNETHEQMLEMKIAEHPDESLREANQEDDTVQLASTEFSNDAKRKLNTTFEDVKEEQEESAHGKVVKASEFDRLLLMHSDSILQDVTDLINDIRSSEASKKPSTTTITKVESVEKLVDELRNDINHKMFVSTSELNKDELDQMKLSCIAGRFNSLELSGMELCDITCPQQVMEQSVPNSSRLDRPLSAVFLGKPISPSPDFTTTAYQNDLIDFDSNNMRNNSYVQSDAFATIHEMRNSSAGDSPATSNNAFEFDQEEIQRKICSALRLLEEEEQKTSNIRRRNRLSGDPAGSVSARSHSPFPSVSNPDSRPSSRVESCQSSPRIREERNAPRNDKNQSRCKANFNYDSMECLRNPRQHYENKSSDFKSGSRSARSCSCLLDNRSNESLPSARSVKSTVEPHSYEDSQAYKPFETGRVQVQHSKIPRPNSGGDEIWETKDDKTKQIFSFLDQVEKSDQEVLFGLRFDNDGRGKSNVTSQSANLGGISYEQGHIHAKKSTSEESRFRTLDSLIRKGSVELAREILLQERKLDEAQQAIKLLEESLLNQRELNIRNLRNSEKDFRKRMKMQKEEFDIAFTRNEALINEMATEKRALQEKLDKLIKNFEGMEEKHKEQIKSMQQKHLDEIRRLRKMQQNAEQSLKQKLAGNKAQVHEIREMTVKGLEPEVQRIIQRHQQEMSEMRSWHADEVRETEERYQRKLHMQMEDMREKFNKEKEDLMIRERELANRRLVAELKQKDDEIENLKRRLTNDIFEERERAVSEEVRLKETMQESVRKAQIKGEVELENLKQEYETKLANLERRHESELKSLKDVFEAEKMSWLSNQTNKLEQSLSGQEAKLRETFQAEKEKEWREKERKLKEEFEKFRTDDEKAFESRFRRMQEKLQAELEEMDKSEKDIKTKFTQAKSDLLAREEEIFSLKASTSLKEKQLIDLQEINMKMQEERVNLTSVIRREFVDQIHGIEEECRSLKVSIVEMQSNSKLQLEQKQLGFEKIISEKNAEIEEIGNRVKQALGRKDETISELQKQLEMCSFQTRHLEELLEEQRKEFLHSMKVTGNNGTSSSGGGGTRKK